MLNRGDVYYADLNPYKGSEQAGTRPVVIVQVNQLNQFGNTVVIVPFTASKGAAARLPSSVSVRRGDGGLSDDSVALCHQVRVIDKRRLGQFLGSLSPNALSNIDAKLRFTLGI